MEKYFRKDLDKYSESCYLCLKGVSEMHNSHRILWSLYNENNRFISFKASDQMFINYHKAFIANLMQNELTKINPYIVHHFAAKRFLK